MDEKAFFQKLLPYAQRVRAALGVPEPVTLIHWAFESGFESPKWIGHYNYAGITYAGERTGFRRYDSIDAFVDDYIRTLRLSYYREFLEICRRGASVEDCLLALARSPWDAGHYGGDGRNIVALYRRVKDELESVLSGEVPEWAREALDWAVAAGITDGLRPNDAAARAEVWTMLWRLKERLASGFK